MSFLRKVVLPSVEVPEKSSYSIPESLSILGCSRSTFYRKIARGELTLSRDKRIYIVDLENYFRECEKPETNHETKD